MSDLQYVVRTVYEADDRQSATIAKISGASKAADFAIQGVSKAAGFAATQFDALAQTAWSFAKVAGAAGLAGALAGIKVGIFDVNAGLESTVNAMASSLNILGGANGFADGLDKAKTLVEGIRDDSASLPGEFSDFVNIASTLTAPLTNAGKGIAEIRDMTRATAIAAASVGVGFDQAGREMAMLLAGHAGAHNILGQRLGINTDTKVNGKDFNKASDVERFEFIMKKLEKAKDALPAFTNSWAGLTSTVSDGVKRLLGEATLPLFERVKESLKDVISWLDSPKAHAFAEMVGQKLVVGFDWIVGKAKILASHWHTIAETATKFAAQLRSVVERIWPVVEKIGKTIGSKFAADPMGFLKSLAIGRAGLGVLSNVGSIVSAGEGVGAAGAGGAIATAGPAMIAVGAIFMAVVDDFAGSAERAQRMFNEWSNTMSDVFTIVTEKGGLVRDLFDGLGAGSLAALDAILGPVKVQVDAWIFAITELNDAYKYIRGALADAYDSSMTFRGAVDDLGKACRMVLHPLDSVRDAILKLMHIDPASGGNDFHDILNDASAAAKEKGAKDEGFHTSWGAAIANALGSALDKEKVKGASSALAGAGATNVTVTAPITILNDPDPERLAMGVTHHVMHELQNAKLAFGVPTFRVEGG